MENVESLSHVRWECEYHVVFIPQYRKKVIYGKLCAAIGRIFRDLCERKGVKVPEGHAMPDPIHICLKIPPKHAVSYSMGFLKEKSSVRVHLELLNNQRMTGLRLWAPSYWVSTVGRDESSVRRYCREQENWDRGQQELFE